MANAPDVVYEIVRDGWYGWPTTWRYPITDMGFDLPPKTRHGFPTAEHPPVEEPLATLKPHTAAMKFDFALEV